MKDIINDSEMVIHKWHIKYSIPIIADRINQKYKDKKFVIVSIMDAAYMFTADLVRYIKSPIKLRFIKVSSYFKHKHSENPNIETELCPSDIFNEDILIVDTILDSGNTIRSVKHYLNTLSPKSIKVCTLVIKDNKDNKDVYVDFYGFNNIDGFLFGYGADYACGTYRNLEHIYRVKDKNYGRNGASIL